MTTRFEEIPVVILCGGTGMRLREETEFIPKPMVKVASIPILLHIMNHYSHYGFRRFILCLGYKGYVIKEYFLNWANHSSDFTLHLEKGRDGIEYHNWEPRSWSITFAETGQKTEGGGRIKRIAPYISQPRFMATYGDGVSDVDLRQLYQHHIDSGMIATMTSVQMPTRFGVIQTAGDARVKSFREKQSIGDKINGGFFVFSREIFDYIDGDWSVLEHEPFERLVKQGKLGSFEHHGYWQCMDTHKELILLNKMVEEGNTPWILNDRGT